MFQTHRFKAQWQAQLTDGRLIKLATDDHQNLYTFLYLDSSPVPVRMGPHENTTLSEMIQKITQTFPIECALTINAN